MPDETGTTKTNVGKNEENGERSEVRRAARALLFPLVVMASIASKARGFSLSLWALVFGLQCGAFSGILQFYLARL